MPAPLPPPIQRGNPVTPAPAQKKGTVSFGKPTTGMGRRIILYGTGGIGKTTLASFAPNPAFVDLDESLGRLNMDAKVVSGIETWAMLRSALQSDGWNGVDTIIIDTITKGEELAIAHTLANVKTEKGATATSVEDYGYGKGYVHVFDTFMGLLMDLDRHARAGRNVILIAHDCVAMAPNPDGEDFQQSQPRLQSPTSGKNSIRLRVKEWADEVLFMGYDVSSKGGKGKGSGTRTLYPTERPSCMAKSRSWQDPIAILPDGGSDVWSKFIGVK